MKKILAFLLLLGLLTLAIIGACAGCGESSSSNDPSEAEPEVAVETIVARLQPIQVLAMVKVSVSGIVNTSEPGTPGDGAGGMPLLRRYLELATQRAILVRGIYRGIGRSSAKGTRSRRLGTPARFRVRSGLSKQPGAADLRDSSASAQKAEFEPQSEGSAAKRLRPCGTISSITPRS